MQEVFYGGDRDPLPLFMALDDLIEQGVNN
jgi:hypothetical protein